MLFLLMTNELVAMVTSTGYHAWRLHFRYDLLRDANYLASKCVRCAVKMREMVLECVRHATVTAQERAQQFIPALSMIPVAVDSSIAFVPSSRSLHHSTFCCLTRW